MSILCSIKILFRFWLKTNYAKVYYTKVFSLKIAMCLVKNASETNEIFQGGQLDRILPCETSAITNSMFTFPVSCDQVRVCVCSLKGPVGWGKMSDFFFYLSGTFAFFLRWG